MATGNIRQSNIELLRIISMLIIILYHFTLHSVIPNSPDYDYFTKPLKTVLHIGVICFILISGYWGIKFSLKGFVKLIFYCSFYSILIYLVSVFIEPSSFSVKDTVKSIIPDWWYVKVYLCLYLLAPIINIPLNTGSNQTILLFIVILGVVSYGFGQYVLSLSSGKNPLNFVFIYYIGKYLKTGLFLSSKFNYKILLTIYLLSTTFIFFIILLTEIYFPFASNRLLRFFYSYNGIGLVINAVLFFLVFTRIQIFSTVINWFASSTLSVYLLHENEYISKYLYDFVNNLYVGGNNIVIISMNLLILSIFILIVSVLIDKLISPIIQFLFKHIIHTRFFLKLDTKVSQLLNGTCEKIGLPQQ